ncbi:beta-L-arabinofuranosidase domain-containing protein [Alishewanella longhuensis]
MQRRYLILWLVCWVWPGYASIEPFPLQQVQITSGPFYDAQQTNIRYLLTLEPDKLLAPYRREAGLAPKQAAYQNWESDGLDGHIGGHYLSALAILYSATGDQRLLNRLNSMLDELALIQQQHKDGYLGGIPDSRKLWKQIAAGDIRADLFVLNDSWVPWYNLHKVFAGLYDAWFYTGSAQAKAMLFKLSDWVLNLTSQLSDAQMQQMLYTEYGGMNDILAQIAAIENKPEYLQLAQRFSELRLLQPLLAKEDKLDGLHANTQIPKVIGLAQIALQTDNSAWLEAADFFWQQVVYKRSVAIGGNSVREHFHPANDFSSMLDDVEGPETCNTYNMLKLSKLLYQHSGKTDYLEYYERALYNHILSSQHPQHGGLVYFTPMRPNHYRLYSSPEHSMWCCVGSGIENHAKYGELIYAKAHQALYVNLFVDSTLQWPEQQLSLQQQTRFPDEPKTTLQLTYQGELTLHIRYPAWVAAGALTLSINGQAQQINNQPGEYISLTRHWQPNDTIVMQLPMALRAEPLPDQSANYAILYGPIVLASKTPATAKTDIRNFIADSSRMGHIASGPLCPEQQTPVFSTEHGDILQHIQPIPGESLQFQVAATAMLQQQPMQLVPFFRVHDSRYTLYFPAHTAATWQQQLSASAAVETEQTQLLDFVRPGEQQPEADHQFKGEQTEAGVHRNRHWRHARGWFSYQLNPQGETRLLLRVGYYTGDAGRRFTITINGQTLAEVELTEQTAVDGFYHVDYAIPANLLSDSAQPFEVRFIANAQSIAGGIYQLQLLKHASTP